MSDILHIDTMGQGSELFLLHGWGLHAGVWDRVLPGLAERYRVTRVDLPGHGLSRAVSLPDSLAAVAEKVLAAAPRGAVWLGWSLGGLIAQRAAIDGPHTLRGLILVATTPRFVTAADWPHAMPAEQLQEFASGLSRDYEETLRRFLSLQVRGDEAARAVLRDLREMLFARGAPSRDSLVGGLRLLGESDLRAELGRIAAPTLVLGGSDDRLTPPGACEALARAIPGADWQLIPKSAHAPFLSHPDSFVATVVDYMRDLESHAQPGVKDVR